jgi:hypothetical protein
MTAPAFTSDPGTAPYNVAYLVDDRSQCYHAYAVDRELDDGLGASERDAPVDYPARRDAIIDFYGGRCGRCGTAIGKRPGADESIDHAPSLGYVYSVAGPEDVTWALAHLVAVCEPCYDLLAAETADDVGTFGDAYRRAPQFPTWAGDPRVAVERHALTGREAWVRHRLAARIDDTPACDVNERVARRASLARSTPAAHAVALGKALVRDDRGALSTANRRLRDRWRTLDERERAAWRERAVDPDTALVDGPFEPATNHQSVQQPGRSRTGASSTLTLGRAPRSGVATSTRDRRVRARLARRRRSRRSPRVQSRRPRSPPPRGGACARADSAPGAPRSSP